MSRLLKRKRHSVSDLHYHLVAVTKYRRKVLTLTLQATLRDYLRNALESNGCCLEDFGAEPDHIHLLVAAPPTMSPSVLAKLVKGSSSKFIRSQRLPEVTKTLWGDALWSSGYFVASAGGATLETLKNYVNNQNPNVDSSRD